jgi:hypothetical protein
MQLTFNGTKVIGRQLHIELADKDTGNPFPVRMNEDGSYLHKFRGNKAFMTALSNFEEFTTVNGKPIREVWLTTLKDHLAIASA